MTALLDSAMRSLRGARFKARFVEISGSWLLVTLLAAGCGILLGRLFGPWAFGQAACLLLGAFTAPLAAWIVARRDVWGPAREAAWLDVSAGGDGSLVTYSELGDARWNDQVQRALRRTGERPTPNWKGALLRMGAGAGFAALALWVPVQTKEQPVQRGLFDGTLASLADTLETLTEEVGLTEDRASELVERLERLHDEADAGRDPEATFEALDTLERDMEQAAAEVADAIEEAANELASQNSRGWEDGNDSMQAVLEGLAEGGLQPKSPSELETMELPAGLELPPGLSWPEGSGDPEFGMISPDQLAGLSEALRQDLLERMQALADAGLLGELALAGAEFQKARDAQGAQATGELCAKCASGEP